MHTRVVLGVGKGVLFRAVQACPHRVGKWKRARVEDIQIHIPHTHTHDQIIGSRHPVSLTLSLSITHTLTHSHTQPTA